jgi:NAD-dependent dihydropyrimidine dehydrogenase PreA subunit
MLILEDLCIGCGQCVIICPVQAIKLVDNRVFINDDSCVECNVCYRNAECPVKAIKLKKLKWPRIVRNPFSDVISTHKLTGVPGRGTEEMKTNDVTNRFKEDEFGFSIEVGRPGVGTLLRNIDIFVSKLSQIGVEYEEASPITALLTEDRLKIKPDLKFERVLSAIIEFKVHEDKFLPVLHIIQEIDKTIETVFTVGIVTRLGKNHLNPMLEVLSQEGFSVRPNAKVNVGLGKV